ncbi:hypothetical protein B0H13DRAFT_2401352, partial [Mycena leptocephala]
WPTLWGSPPIRLKKITTNHVTTDLLAYLSLYSGVETMNLLDVDGGSLDASNHLANTFFNTVLPCHANSLIQLRCPARYESLWSFGSHNAGAVIGLHNLEILGMSVN